MRIELVTGDITAQHVDAIVNAANSSLLGGGGVDGAIHRKGGPEILAACRELRAGHYGGGLPVGQAVATTAGRLPARWVIHTVGPVYRAPATELPGPAPATELPGPAPATELPGPAPAVDFPGRAPGPTTGDRSSLLRDCYTNSLTVADELGAETVAFPLISSGAFRWPVRDAVVQAVTALRSAGTAVRTARLVLFDDATRAIAEELL